MSGSVVSWESSESLSQLEWEECAGEREREKCSPSPREREEDALFRARQRRRGGIVLVSNDTVSCCSIQRRQGGGGGGRVPPGRLSLGPAAAGGCPREGAVHVQETQQQDLPAESSLARPQHCNGSRPSGLVPAETMELSLFVLWCQCR